MESAKIKVFSVVRLYSTLAIAIFALLSGMFGSLLGHDSLNWQVALAIFALAVGIPHGALDHLVTLPRTSRLKMSFFIAIYVAIALLAIWVILQWNVWGFIAVVVMSALHFGIGDSAFIAELDRLTEVPRKKSATFAYAMAAGFIPVVIPLINSRSESALEKVNSHLLNWHHGYTREIAIALAIIATAAIAHLATMKRYRDLVDIFALIALVSIAPPLVAFAAYFGCWHAMRHTARLSSLLPSSQAHFDAGRPWRAFRSAIVPGLPALAGTFIFVLILAGFLSESISDHFLWLTLVTIWALTVPHMIVTARLDRAALKI